MGNKLTTKKVLLPINIAIQNYIPYLASVLDPFLQQNPIWQGAFYSAIGLYGVYMASNQNEVNEIIEFIKDHPDEFKEEIVKSKEFKKGFLEFTEQYFKQRIDKKKDILKNIFLDFSTNKENEEYDLERLNNDLLNISLHSLEFLIFLKKYPIKDIEDWFKRTNTKKSSREILELLLTQPFLQISEKWLVHKYEFDIDVSGNKSEYIKSNIIFAAAQKYGKMEISHRYDDTLFELSSLGIVDIIIKDPKERVGFNKDFAFTGYGIRFLNNLSHK